MPADDQVGALAVADLLVDDRLDHDAVLVVAGVEAAAVAELHRLVRQRVEDVGERHLGLELDVDDGQRGAVVVHLEAALGDLPERDRDQPVEAAPVVGHPVLERYVDQPLDLAAGPADQGDRAGVAQPDRRPGLVPLHRLESGAGIEGGAHGADSTSPTRREFARRPGADPA